MYNKKYKRRDSFDFRALQVDVYYTGNSEDQRAEDLEKALAKFKKLLMKEGTLQTIRDRQYFKSPGQKRYEKHKKFLYKLNQKKEKTHKRYSQNKDK